VAFLFWFVFGAAAILFIGWGGDDTTPAIGLSDNNRSVIIGILALLFIIDSIILFRFDKIAVSRAKDKFSRAQEKYEYDLKDYEHLRGKWIELETVRLENQMSLSSANMSNKGSYIVASASEVGIQPSSEDTTASEIEEISTSDETN
jgi:hypothetical protein